MKGIIEKYVRSLHTVSTTKEDIEDFFSPPTTLLYNMPSNVYNDKSNYRNKMDYVHKSLFRSIINENLEKITNVDMLHLMASKYNQNIIQPGEMVGISAAQSIGEPLTQFTLNTFHSTGLAGINEKINGMARFGEILGFSKKSKNSVIHVHMLTQEDKAHLLHSLNRPTLKDICQRGEIVYNDGMWEFRYYLSDSADLDVSNLPKHYVIERHDNLFIVKVDFKAYDYENIVSVFHLILNSGEHSDIVIHDIVDNRLDIENVSIEDLLQFNGIDWTQTTTGDLQVIYANYGIEATRAAIIEELTQFYVTNGSQINYQHISLVADTMTCTGVVVPLNRYGMNREDQHVLSRASFEKSMEQFIEAAIFEEEDPLTSVSSRISVGRVIKGGTGIIDVAMDYPVKILEVDSVFDRLNI